MLTPSQNEVYNELKKYRNFPRRELYKFPQLAHIKNPAERYRYFCEAKNEGRSVVEYKPLGRNGAEEDDLFIEKSPLHYA